ncbi:MAG: L,D-transpeptidase family protein [Alphaproteobacteria bacterium]|nr:L,D-transpeptidase family protein [Alphaproteobacteria bacterium]MBL6951980.1 L,D-transpeptidase family protein [Alphaproteobacteria bacterium]
MQVTADGWLYLGERRYRCALGRGGVRLAKREGDGATPAGLYALRQLLYRADRLARPDSGLPMAKIQGTDGWCDDPGDAAYNRAVTLPYGASAESLWRADGLYDLVVITGHNDDPVVPGRGSAIFIHLASPDYGPTEGCIALSRPDLLAILPLLAGDSEIQIDP